MHIAVAGDDNDLSVFLLSSGWYTLRTHCDTLRKSRRAVVAVCARSAASRRRALAKLGAAAASATEHEMSKPSNLRSLRHRAPSSRCPAAAATKACVAALASDVHLIPEKPAA
tara:strand:- start:104 stop:442 length:339 start_codon:yes stop_codon:yes gene_type:complete